MRLGFRVNLGPLSGWLPLDDLAAPLAWMVKLCLWTVWLSTLAVFALLAWPYLLARRVAPRQGWTRKQTVLYGLTGTGGWWLLGLALDALGIT